MSLYPLNLRMIDHLDVERARKETPGCRNVIHFNNAGASLMPEPVLQSVIQHLQLEAERGGYEAYEQSFEKTEQVYREAAALLNCAPDEIAFVENATRAWDMAFYSLKFQPGDRILTAQAEYSSNYIAYLQIARKTGAVVEVIPNDETGQLSIESLSRMIDRKVKLISITHVPTNGGLVNPAEEIGRIAGEAGILYLLDACQSVGQMKVDVRKIGCHMLSGTGRKYLRGPRATGFLFAQREILQRLEPPFLDMHAAEWTSKNDYTIRNDARRFENWEQNYAGKIGLATAIRYAAEWGLDNIERRVTALAELFRSKLQHIPQIVVTDIGRQKCGIVTFHSSSKDAYTIKRNFASRNINVSVSPQSSTLLDMQARGLNKVVRASVHYYNTEKEIDMFCAALTEIINH